MVFQTRIPVTTVTDVFPARTIIHQEDSPYAGRILVRDVSNIAMTRMVGLCNKDRASPKELQSRQKRDVRRRIENKADSQFEEYQLLTRQLIFSCNPNLVQSELQVICGHVVLNSETFRSFQLVHARLI